MIQESKEDVESGASSVAAQEDSFDATLVSTTERRLMTKIDLHLLPVLCVLYLLAFLDRVNISNAVIFGLRKDLGIESGNRYNTALTIFFVPYILFEIPSNILLKKLKPHVWLSGCMFGFGLVTLCQGLVQNYAGLLVTRFLLGLLETGMFPGCFYLLGMWYRRTEAQKRFSFFFSSTTLAGAFGGLLASAIGRLDGVRGFLGWRWIFILEGLITCIVSFAFFFVIPGFPEEAKWLNEEERNFIRGKLAKDVGAAGHEVSLRWKDVLDVFKDYKIFVGGLMYFGLVVPAYGYAYFAPTIIRTFGYGPIQTQLYSIPPWAAAFGVSLTVAYLSDRLRNRFAFTLIPICIAIAGFAILLNVHDEANRALQYGALFLITSGAYSAMPIIICWYSMNLGGHKRRSVGIAWQIGFGNIGGIIATYSFLEKDRPQFRPGHVISISFICLSAAMCVVYFFLLLHRNRTRDKLAAVDSSGALKQAAIDPLQGDLSPSFRYQL
ncbi:MFS transporter [Histoplasma capsulatum var. duboisii H88]|uniref:MFS transporter n=1 Tax=Ajellomyces capsulatus (strain H88) TaxID=544711 RepID=F0USQ0_AJEC8|nr:MFS transporter [Histoplasma capsulatum var. duboisii H88]QSS54525.1 MFS transporter [Histoplasma capsulatum var. duboisii H88]